MVMKWPYYVKHKVKAIAFLMVILGIILLGNVWATNSFSKLDNSISSIYKDRLKVSEYIYEISNTLYKKRLLFDADLPQEEMQKRLAEHNGFINRLIQDYEQTALTKEEKKQWTLFKAHLSDYNTAEQQHMPGAGVFDKEMNTKFDNTVANLDALSKIQTGEGYNLQKASHSIVGSRLVFSYLEISLIIVLGIFTLIILSATDRNIFRPTPNSILN